MFSRSLSRSTREIIYDADREVRPSRVGRMIEIAGRLENQLFVGAPKMHINLVMTARLLLFSRAHSCTIGPLCWCTFSSGSVNGGWWEPWWMTGCHFLRIFDTSMWKHERAGEALWHVILDCCVTRNLVTPLHHDVCDACDESLWKDICKAGETLSTLNCFVCLAYCRIFNAISLYLSGRNFALRDASLEGHASIAFLAATITRWGNK